MKTIQIPARLPEKQDIIYSPDTLTNEEIGRFVCDFEEIQNTNEINTKKIQTERFGDIHQFQKVRIDNSWIEFYSVKTATVYRMSYYEGVIYFEKIFFKNSRHDGIGYGLDVDTVQAIAYCTRCNTTIPLSTNWLGNHFGECVC